MKKLLKHFVLLLFISQAYSLIGIGGYGNFDLIKYPSGTSGDITSSGIQYSGFDNAVGGGLFVYIDAIPIIDLQLDLEAVGNLYQFTPYVSGIALNTDEVPWGRTSMYITGRKKIIGLSIPLLAKVQLYGGLGFNNHKVVPVLTKDIIDNAFSDANDLATALEQSTSNDDSVEQLGKFMRNNTIKTSGIHFQTGIQGKLLMINAFVNARYTIAKNVIPGKSGFASLWFGVGLSI